MYFLAVCVFTLLFSVGIVLFAYFGIAKHHKPKAGTV
jgi:hypothetical protein